MIRFLAAGLMVVSLTSCKTYRSAGTKAERASDRKNIEDQLGSEQSLKADRDELANLRKEIPEEKRQSNDELALYLNLLKGGTEHPENVRSKFSSMMEKRRSSFRAKVEKLRENYRTEEYKRREKFLDGLKVKRDKFNGSKHTAKESTEFFIAQDKERQEYFANERDRRSSFESEISSQSKDFDSYMREKHNEFNERYREYSREFHERARTKEKEKQLKVKDSGADAYKAIDQVPTKDLKTNE